MLGVVTKSGIALQHDGRIIPLAPTLTPLGLAVREACAQVLAGEVKPCRWCGSIAPCDCERWMEYITMQDPDPHGDLSELSESDIPY